MKTSPVSIIISVVLIASLLGGVCIGAQDKPKGLLGAFSGEDDPSKDRSPKPAEDTKAKKPVQPKKPAPDVIYSPPDPKALDKRIKQLEGLNYDNIKHAPDLEKAKQRINDLRQRARRLRLRNDKETAATVKALADHKKRMEERWLKLAATLKDGKKRTAQEWAEIANGVFGEGHELELPADDPAKAADDAIGVPTPDELDSDEGDEPAAEDATDPLEPPKAPKTKIETAPPKLEDLIETMKGQEKPEGMHPVTWARLLDTFGRDMAEFRAAFMEAMRRLKEKRSREYDPVIAALKAAQNTYSDLAKLGDDAGEGLRRHLAYRIYQAELAQLRLRREDLRQIARERAGDPSNRPMSIRTNPMAPENTLNDLARMIEVSGTPGPPAAGAFDNANAEGIPNLYPPGTITTDETTIQFGNMMRSMIARNRSQLARVHDRMARAEEAVKQREQNILKREAARLRANDRLEGKEGDPLNEAYNRRTLRKIQRELAASRQEHVEQLKSKLEAEAQILVKRLEIDYERLDGMSKTEKPAKPD